MSRLIWVRGRSPHRVPHPLITNASPMRFLGWSGEVPAWEQCPQHLIAKNLRPGRDEFEVSETDPSAAPPQVAKSAPGDSARKADK